MKVKVNQEACIGCGACTQICEDVFEIDDATGLSKTKVDEVKEENQQACKDAIESCPTGAISEEK